MVCEEFEHMLDNYESLTDKEKLMMAEHAAECKSCRDDMDFMLSIIGVTKALPEIKAPDDFLDRLNVRIDLEEIKGKRKRRLHRLVMTDWKRYSAAAACLLLAAVVGVNGNMLVSRMSGNGSGVITEERVTSDDSNRNNESEYELTSEQDNIAEPVSDASLMPLPSSPPEKTEQLTVPQITAQPKKETVPAQNNRRAVPAVNPATDAPVYTQRPIAAQPKRENDADFVSGFELAKETPVPEDNAVTPEPYTLARENYRIPIESVTYGETASIDENNEISTVDGYSLAKNKAEIALGMYTPIDKDGNPTDYPVEPKKVSDVPSGSSILVSSEDEGKVRSLMDRYITGNYGIYYMTTEDKLNRLFEEMDKAGINYEKFISSSTEKISFKLVVVS